MEYNALFSVQSIHILFVFINVCGQCNNMDISKGKGQRYEGRYSRDVNEYEVVVPRKVNEDGSFLSFSLPHFYARAQMRSKRELMQEGQPHLHYALPLSGKDHHLELWANHGFMSPSLVSERRGHGAATDVRKVRLRRVRDQQCHYTGVVRGHEGSRVALSGCDGLAGYVRVKGEHYFVEPVRSLVPEDDGQHLHLVYRASNESLERRPNRKRNCGSTDDWPKAWAERLQWELLNTPGFGNHSMVARSLSKRRFLQTCVVADKQFTAYHNDSDVENYILTIMNMVSDFYHDSSVGNALDIVVVRIVYLEKEEEEMDLMINPDAENTLKSFCKWQIGINPKERSHPNRHDIAVLLTRYDICSDNRTNCDLLGLAYLATACKEDESCCINEDSGLVLGVVVAHEMGHVMGSSHDEVETSGCSPQAEDQSYHVMSPYVVLRTSTWSKCSNNFITTFLDNALGECLLNEPQDHNFQKISMPPGAMYGASYQCQLAFGIDDVCPMGGDDMCKRLYCKTSDSGCASKGDPPADGTKCGENMWCYDLKCVEIGKRPKAVNGDWGEWSKWSECSRTCGGGVQKSERNCDNPAPQNKGRFCLGQRKKYRTCKTQPCDSNSPTYREVQCTEFNTKPLNGVLYKWRPYKKTTKYANPCELVCINEKSTFNTLAPRVRDGTPCKVGTRNLCVGGVCVNVGCDWVVDSDAVEDVCGVCRGDGTQCTLVESLFDQLTGKGYVKIVTIPPESHNILVQELKPSVNTIAVSDKEGKTFYLNGDRKEQLDGEHSFGDRTIGIYSHPEPEKEQLIIKGPTKQELILYIVFFGEHNVGVNYRFYQHTANSSYKSHYDWEFLDWTDCSVRCGGGSQESDPTCVEKQAGKVSAFFCASIPKPNPMIRNCNQLPCKYRWRTGPWGPCSGCVFLSGLQRRKVECMHENPHGNEDDEILCEPFSCNKAKKPSETRLCNSNKLCKDNSTSNDTNAESNSTKSPERIRDVATCMKETDDDDDGTKCQTSSILEPPESESDKQGNIVCHPNHSNIIVDRVPIENEVIYEVPIIQKNDSKVLSEEAEELMGDKMSAVIDTPHQQVVTGAKAIDKRKEITKKHQEELELRE